MCAEYKHDLPVQFLQTLSNTAPSVFDTVYTLDIRRIADAVILITGDASGGIAIFKSSLQPIKFALQHRFQAHTTGQNVHALHLHPGQSLFVSTSVRSNDLSNEPADVKVWNIQDITSPRLVKCIPHPHRVCCAKYSESGLIATGCNDGILPCV